MVKIRQLIRKGEIMPNQIEGFLEGTILGGVIGAAFGILYAS